MRRLALAVAVLGVAAQAMAEPPPPPPAGSVTISAAALEKLRTGGSPTIEPPAGTVAWMLSDGVKRVSADVKVCISTTGDLAYGEIAKPSAYASYDERARDIVATWTFHPYTTANQAVPACAVVTVAFTAPAVPAAPPMHPPTPEAAAALRADVDMICGAAQAIGGTDFMSSGPYIAEHMKTDLLRDLFANIRTTSTLEMFVTRIRAAMVATGVKRCATIDVWLRHPR